MPGHAWVGEMVLAVRERERFWRGCICRGMREVTCTGFGGPACDRTSTGVWFRWVFALQTLDVHEQWLRHRQRHGLCDTGGMEENNQSSQDPGITSQEAPQQSQYAPAASQQSEYEQSAQAAPEPQSETPQPQYGQEYGQQSAQPQYDQSQPQQYNQQSSAQPQPAPDQYGQYNQYGQSQLDQPGYAQYSQPASQEYTYGQGNTQTTQYQEGYQYASPQQQYEQPAASAAYPAAGVAMGEGYQYQQQPYGQQYQQSYEQPYQAAQGYPYPPANYGGYGYVGQKSKIAAGLLGILFGSLGVHNFYLGNTGKAVAQLLLTLIGWIVLIGPVIAGIWGLIEGILILTSSTGSEWHRDGKGYELQD